MSGQTWTLTDVSRGLHESDFCVSASDLADASGSWKATQRTLRGGLRDGVDLVELDNGRMRLFVIPTRGMGIWRAEAGDGQTLGWKSPVRGPVHPGFVPVYDPCGLGWLEGFDELVVRCGMESNGAPEFDDEGRLVYPLHGRVANRPAHFVDLTVDHQARTMTLRGTVEETRFHFLTLRLETSVTTSFDSMGYTIRDRVVNFGGKPAQMQMLYHVNVGEPLLDAGSQLVAPVGEVALLRDPSQTVPEDWNVYGPPVAGSAEECYAVKLQGDEAGQTQVMLKNSSETAGVAIGVNTRELSCFTLWKNLVAREDGYVTGLEPGTNFPNGRSMEEKQGRVVGLNPGEEWSAEVTFDWLTAAEEVRATEEAIGRL